MRFVFYTHSLVSDWNHGNAHFLRGVMRVLREFGHEALALEPEDGWSRRNLLADQGEAALRRFARDFPDLSTATYAHGFDHEAALDGADVVIVHEWTDPGVIARLASLRRRAGGFILLFHDTHHRGISAEAEIARLGLDDFDGILAFGASLRERYVRAGWGRQVFVWHEAADDSLFKPSLAVPAKRDVIWIGNWGDNERSREIGEYLVGPVRELGLRGDVRGVRYPPEAIDALSRAGLRYGGWIANADVPAAFAQSRVTLHIPRRPYVEALPGIPTIRVFEALACGIPLVSAPWQDSEGLFRPEVDFLSVASGEAMAQTLRHLLAEPDCAAEMAAAGRATVLARHTCRHRVQELLAILRTLGRDGSAERQAAEAVA
ncbi:CgeB family protein [Marinivivus vitaminiproducens]|uniref:CgeB family protein n=1 Tax=Marinivivus vitaminiproducens TaxID=3035935 RepID=UPI0027A979CA|nr:glycosyltransferase [Geminicoccaceae bacterium SCSIO 64248]